MMSEDYRDFLLFSVLMDYYPGKPTSHRQNMARDVERQGTLPATAGISQENKPSLPKPVAGLLTAGRSKIQRMLHPTTAADYGLSVSFDEFMADEEGKKEFAEYARTPRWTDEKEN